MKATVRLTSTPGHSGHVDLHLAGEFDAASHEVLRHACALASLIGGGRVAYDLIETTHVDAAALRLLEAACTEALRDGGLVMLVATPGTAMRGVVEAYGLAPELLVADTREAACAIFGCPPARPARTAASLTPTRSSPSWPRRSRSR